MASKLIGRCKCPECDFASAHVKIKTDKENANPYRHCPECGAQYFPRNKMQGDNLLKMARPEKVAIAPPAPPKAEKVQTEQEQEKTAPATEEKPAKKPFKLGVFS